MPLFFFRVCYPLHCQEDFSCFVAHFHEKQNSIFGPLLNFGLFELGLFGKLMAFCLILQFVLLIENASYLSIFDSFISISCPFSDSVYPLFCSFFLFSSIRFIFFYYFNRFYPFLILFLHFCDVFFVNETSNLSICSMYSFPYLSYSFFCGLLLEHPNSKAVLKVYFLMPQTPLILFGKLAISRKLLAN